MEVAAEEKPEGVEGSEHNDSDYDGEATFSNVTNTEQLSASSMVKPFLLYPFIKIVSSTNLVMM